MLLVKCPCTDRFSKSWVLRRVHTEISLMTKSFSDAIDDTFPIEEDYY